MCGLKGSLVRLHRTRADAKKYRIQQDGENQVLIKMYILTCGSREEVEKHGLFLRSLRLTQKRAKRTPHCACNPNTMMQ